MANISYGGVEKTATFEMTTALKALVMADTQEVKGYGFGVCGGGTNGTIDIGSTAGKPLLGVIVQIDGRGLATVRFSGGIEGVKIAKIGTTPAFPPIEYVGLGVNATCAVVTLATGRQAIVAEVDEAAATATIIM